MVSPHKSKEEGNGHEHPLHSAPEIKQGKENASEILFKEQIEQERARADELKGLLQRVQAEFENYMKRSENERKAVQGIVKMQLIQEFLPLMDSFDAAMEKLGKKQGSGEAMDGISLLRKQLGQIMGRHGIQEMKSVGNMFDPEKHECLVFENRKDKEDGIVLEEIQKGYTMKGKIIRHAKVKVNKRG